MTQINEKDPRTYAIIGAAMEVHNQLGHGFLEAVYHAALQTEFDERSIPFESEVEISVTYKDRPLPIGYRADFICYDGIIVELMAISKLSGADSAQVINYLKASKLQLGLLLNFGASSLEYTRLVL